MVEVAASCAAAGGEAPRAGEAGVLGGSKSGDAPLAGGESATKAADAALGLATGRESSLTPFVTPFGLKAVEVAGPAEPTATEALSAR